MNIEQGRIIWIRKNYLNKKQGFQLYNSTLTRHFNQHSYTRHNIQLPDTIFQTSLYQHSTAKDISDNGVIIYYLSYRPHFATTELEATLQKQTIFLQDNSKYFFRYINFCINVYFLKTFQNYEYYLNWAQHHVFILYRHHI